MFGAIKNMDPKTRNYIIIGVILLVLFIGIAIYYYKKGKKQVSVQALPWDVPGEPSGSGNSGASGSATNDQLKVLAQKLYSDMDGFNWLGHDIGPYQELSTLSDTDFVRLYNLYNTLYQQDSGQTLKQWIDNEKFDFYALTDGILQRMAKLNLVKPI